jgi:hypothetical protein
LVAALGIAAIALVGVLFLRDSGNSDSGVRAVLTSTLIEDRPAYCTNLYTQRFVEQMTGKRGLPAIKECRKDADGEPDAKSLAITDVQMSEFSARATVAAHGGEAAGTTFVIDLVRAPGWKLDRMVDVEVELPIFLRQVRIEAVESKTPTSEADCYIHKLRQMGEARIERAYLSGSTGAFDRMAADCLNVNFFRHQLRVEIVKSFLRSGGPRSAADCVADHVLGSISDERLRSMVQRDSTAGLLGPSRAAGVKCAALELEAMQRQADS